MALPISPTNAKSKHIETAAGIMHKFLANMNYSPPDTNPLNEELEAFMVKVMDSRNIRCKQLERTVHMAASFIELSYSQLPIEEKRIVVLFLWYLTYVEDQAINDPTPFGQFVQRFGRGLPQLDPILDAFADVLHQIWEQWDNLSANIIIGSALTFMTFSCIELSLDKLGPPVPGNSRFAWFLREGTGIAKSFGSFAFSKTNNLSVMDYAQAIPDIEYWLNLTNDLLSFYKEELSGETNNYIHVRARNEQKTALEVLSEVGKELIISRDIIHASLAHNPRALQAWKATEQGFTHWHLIQERYKLGDLGLLASFSKQ